MLAGERLGDQRWRSRRRCRRARSACPSAARSASSSGSVVPHDVAAPAPRPWCGSRSRGPGPGSARCGRRASSGVMPARLRARPASPAAEHRSPLAAPGTLPRRSAPAIRRGRRRDRRPGPVQLADLAEYERAPEEAVATEDAAPRRPVRPSTRRCSATSPRSTARSSASPCGSGASRPGWGATASTSKTSTSRPSAGARGTARRCWRRWPGAASSGATAGSSGPCSTGTSPPSTSTSRLGAVGDGRVDGAPPRRRAARRPGTRRHPDLRPPVA